ncbi:MAG: BolA/IbaG family iron-sulfur metabolism protein [Candidatus Marinamargulisbacteria bacterium]
MNTLVNDIETIIQTNIPDAQILVHNINDDGEHFEAIVISKSFNGLPLLKQHQAIMKPLKEAFDEKVHALALKTFSQDKWDQNKHDHPMIEQKIKEKYQ